jgi:hypothetical protein
MSGLLFDVPVFGLAMLFSLVLPISIIFMRHVTKRQRQAYIRELEHVL